MSTAIEHILSLNTIKRSFIQGNVTVEVLKDISLNVNKGEMVALLGPSGSGKSTLLQIAGLLDSPTAGKVIINHHDCSLMNDRKRTAVRRSDLGFIYQFHHLLPEFTAKENVMMPLMIAGVKHEDANSAAETMLGKLGLSHRMSHRPAELSGGEQQRVAIARALVHKPVLLLADEPTGNLDPATSDQVFNVLLTAVEELGLAMLVVTHNHHLAQRMHRIITLQDGKLVE